MGKLLYQENDGTCRTPEVHDVIMEWDLNWNIGNAIKYLLRVKDPEKDLEKAENYIHKERTGEWAFKKHSVYHREGK